MNEKKLRELKEENIMLKERKKELEAIMRSFNDYIKKYGEFIKK